MNNQTNNQPTILAFVFFPLLFVSVCHDHLMIPGTRHAQSPLFMMQRHMQLWD